MKNPKMIAAVNAIAGVLMIVAGVHNLDYFQQGFLDEIGLFTILSFVQLMGGPTFLYIAFKTLRDNKA